jgi:hypothetical protein
VPSELVLDLDPGQEDVADVKPDAGLEKLPG